MYFGLGLPHFGLPFFVRIDSNGLGFLLHGSLLESTRASMSLSRRPHLLEAGRGTWISSGIHNIVFSAVASTTRSLLESAGVSDQYRSANLASTTIVFDNLFQTRYRATAGSSSGIRWGVPCFPLLAPTTRSLLESTRVSLLPPRPR